MRIFRTFPSANMLSIWRHITHRRFPLCPSTAKVYSVKVTEWCPDNILASPLRDLDPLLQVPIFKKDEVFMPEDSTVEEAQKLFLEGSRHPLQQLASVVNLENLPHLDIPEVAFVGASNVGKSSLIKALFFNNPSLKIMVSKKPGRTRRLHFFNAHDKLSLVDMPGYGENMPAHYITSVETYLQTRRQLSQIFLLLDGHHGISEVDRIGIEMMEEFSRPYALVLTKIDAGTHHEVLRALMKIVQQRNTTMPCCFPQPFLVSAQQGAGLAQLRTFIAHVTGNLHM